MSPMGGMPAGPPPGAGGGPNTALIVVLVVLVLGAVVGGAILLTGGDGDDDPVAGTTLPGEPGGSGEPGDITLPDPGDITLPDPGDVTLPDGPDVTLPDLGDEGGPPDAPPTEGDAELVALADGCYQGDMQACDDLYLQSPFGSDLEDYGDTCGHRFDTSQGFCATALPDPQLPG
jgi:hypothetical protein